MPKLALGLLVLAACGGPGKTAPALVLPADISLEPGKSVEVEGVSLTFLRVKEDSRCPGDVQCVWAGNAAVELSLANGSGAPVVRVINSMTEPTTLEEFGLRMKFKQLTPTPRHQAAETGPARLVLYVEKR